MNWLLLEKNDSKSLFKKFYFLQFWERWPSEFKAHAWKACLGNSFRGFNPLSPPFF